MPKVMKACLCISVFILCGCDARRRAFLEILLFQNVVTRLDAFARGFHFVAIEHQGRSVADHSNHQSLGRLSKSFRQFIERPNFFAVYFIHNPASVRREITVDRVRQNIAQHNDIRMIQINLLQNEVFEEMPEAQVRCAIGFEHVQA